MDTDQETELRAMASDLVLDWHNEIGAKGLDRATKADYEHLIEAAAVVADESGECLTRWVSVGKRSGMSWADIGKILGISRQAAQQRFAPPKMFLGVGRVGTEEDDLLVRTGMNAFNEVAVLEEEGRNGNELVGAAPLKLFFAPRGAKWENRRVTTARTRAVIAEYEDNGWTHALTWYPFVYFSRKG